MGERSLRHELIHSGGAELASRFAPDDPFRTWREEGLIEPWTADNSLLTLAESRSRTGLPTRSAALLLAVLLYLGLVANERGLISAARWTGLRRFQ